MVLLRGQPDGPGSRRFPADYGNKRSYGDHKHSANLQGSGFPDHGGATVTNYGFLISTNPLIGKDRNGTDSLTASKAISTNFSALAVNLRTGHQIFLPCLCDQCGRILLWFKRIFFDGCRISQAKLINAQPEPPPLTGGQATGSRIFTSCQWWARHEELGWIFP